jgi:hypothetical protein
MNRESHAHTEHVKVFVVAKLAARSFPEAAE